MKSTSLKSIILIIATMASSIGATICPIWAIIEFVLYLVKDRPFNWVSVWLSIAAVIAVFVTTLATAIASRKEPQGKSKWKDRLDQLRKERNG